MNKKHELRNAVGQSGVDLGRRNLLKLTGAGVATLGAMSVLEVPFATAQDMSNGANNFYASDRVTMQKVTFKTQYQMAVAGNIYIPTTLDRNARNPAIVVGHPMGAVKEQSASLYATKMAEQGFVAMSIDLPFWGESDGQPRNQVSPDVYAEAFSAAVDFLGTRPFVDRNRIGAIGICGSGSFVVSAAGEVWSRTRLARTRHPPCRVSSPQDGCGRSHGGTIEPGRVFDRTVGLEGVPDGYRAMNDRESIKVMVKL